MKPAAIMTREAFENAIVVNSAIGGSTNAPIHLNAVARHLGISLDNDDWQRSAITSRCWSICSRRANISARTIYHAGGVPAVVKELIKAGLIPHPDAPTVNGKSIGDNCRTAEKLRPRGDPHRRRSAQAGCRLHGSQRQSVRQRDHEDQRDLAGIPRPLFVQPEGPRGVRGPRHGVRRPGGLSRAHR